MRFRGIRLVNKLNKNFVASSLSFKKKEKKRVTVIVGLFY